MAKRLEWMDELRGLAIILVIVHHVLTVPAVLGGASPAWQPVMDFLLPFRMPVMLALSGLLLPRSVAKPLRDFYAGKVQRILWPYVLWMVISCIVLLSPATLVSIWAWAGGAWHLWFLAVLLACYLVAPMTRWIPAWVWPIPMVILAQFPDTNAVVRVLWFGSFFFAGAALARWLDRWQGVRAWAPCLLAVAAVAAAVWMKGSDESIAGFLVSLAGILAAVWIAPRAPRSRGLQFIGERSIVFYLAHFPAIGVAYLLIGDVTWWVLGPLLLVVGIGVPLALTRLSESFLFRLPVPKREGVRAGRA
ncbi:MULTISPECIES: acyltransferase family protein [Helcobacillus]|uniref:Fucose 4-O-acetylase-like acetyltransferase n=1 Tax=Helcobacillus massiliensis TaxID=521392 RepID=A0A839QYC3_9MICO|nr:MULTISPECIES: acyltransferase [Helcobacillus]MBB3022407.1 fucose 4-O-acetylase-like acetyltransferase [Helcobacillus massiliensis]MCG7426950.1 acyltransferase [Helcobacillus sp. ACRRO]MDK7741112.1 acyltransferase [Helcobacillus massiliensis]WOO93921.1 acyltransferase [Helcobacillus massiliensis]